MITAHLWPLALFAILSSFASVQGFDVLQVDEVLGTSGLFGALSVVVPTTFGESSISQAVSKLSSVLKTPGTLDTAYSTFAAKFGKQPNPTAKDVFRTNILSVFEHNLKAKEGLTSFTQAVNKFSDLSLDEVRSKFTGAQVPNITKREILEETPVRLPLRAFNPNPRLNKRADASKDWRQYGIITPIKDQKSCGSCADFACTGALEAAMALYKGTKNLDLSEQELVDCPQGNGVSRCQGNWPGSIFDYQKAEGQVSESDYRYEAKEGSCRTGGKRKVAKVSNWYQTPNKGDENTLKDWVSSYGPHSVIIEVNDAFKSYKSGVMSSPCSNTRYDHAVLLVGYGTENGQDYWIVKNSWGTWWGDKGYIKMARNKGNLCLIADYGMLAQA